MRLRKVKVQSIRGAESRVNRDRNIERSGGEGGRKEGREEKENIEVSGIVVVVMLVVGDK